MANYDNITSRVPEGWLWWIFVTVITFHPLLLLLFLLLLFTLVGHWNQLPMYNKFIHNTNTLHEHPRFRICSKWQLLAQSFHHELNPLQSQRMLLRLLNERFLERQEYLLLELDSCCAPKFGTKVENCQKFKKHMDAAPVLCDVRRCTAHAQMHFWMKTSHKLSHWWKKHHDSHDILCCICFHRACQKEMKSIPLLCILEASHSVAVAQEIRIVK